MNLVKAMVVGLIAAILGALAWAGIAFGAKLEIGYLAWGIGGLVGFAVAWGSRKGGAAPALLAVVLTVLSIAGGKYLAAQWSVNQAFGEMDLSVDEEWSEEYKISLLADDILEQRAVQGVAVPEVEEERLTEQDYPADVWAEALARWQAMDEATRQKFESERKAAGLGLLQQMKQQVVQQAFVGNLGPVDIIFLLLGVATAWQIAFRDLVGEGTA